MHQGWRDWWIAVPHIPLSSVTTSMRNVGDYPMGPNLFAYTDPGDMVDAALRTIDKKTAAARYLYQAGGLGLFSCWCWARLMPPAIDSGASAIPSVAAA